MTEMLRSFLRQFLRLETCQNDQIINHMKEMEKRIMAELDDLKAAETQNATLLTQLATAITAEGQAIADEGTRVVNDLTLLRNQLAQGTVDPAVIDSALASFNSANSAIQTAITNINAGTAAAAAVDQPVSAGTGSGSTSTGDGSGTTTNPGDGLTPVS